MVKWVPFSMIVQNGVFACACRRLLGGSMKQIKFRLTDEEYNVAHINAISNGVNSVNALQRGRF